MTYHPQHRTQSGFVQFVAEWRDGQSPKVNPNAPAHLMLHYDNVTQAFRFKGRMRDAAEEVGGLFLHCGSRGRDGVIRMVGNRLYHEDTPEGFWIEVKGGPFEPNASAFSDIVAY